MEWPIQVGSYQFHGLDLSSRTSNIQTSTIQASSSQIPNSSTPGGQSKQEPIHAESALNHSHLPILFLHGFMGQSADFRVVMEGMRDRHHCLAVDLPGHGQTEVLGPEAYYQMPQVAAGLVQLLDVLEIPTCGLLGYSMGGRLALYLALHAPQRFSWVVLESASPGLKTESERQTRRDRDAQLATELESCLESQDFEQFLKRWYRQPLFASLSQHPDFATLLERRLHNDRKALARSLRQMGTGQQPSLWESLHTLPIPLLLLVGEWDAKFRAIATEMHRDCPKAQIAVVPACGHTIHLEQPQRLISELRHFHARVQP